MVPVTPGNIAMVASISTNTTPTRNGFILMTAEPLANYASIFGFVECVLIILRKPTASNEEPKTDGFVTISFVS
jgi:hypothetical protein